MKTVCSRHEYAHESTARCPWCTTPVVAVASDANGVRHGIDPTHSPFAREMIELVDLGLMTSVQANIAMMMRSHGMTSHRYAPLTEARAKRAGMR